LTRENEKNNMTNAAIVDILDLLCNEARNSVHATFGVMDALPPAAAADSGWKAYVEISRSSADRLLASIDDFRSFYSDPAPASDGVEEFDLGLCLAETIELLNLASRNPASVIRLEAPAEPLPVRQHRQSVENLLARILDSVSKLTPTGEICVSASSFSSDAAVLCGGARVSIAPPDSGLAERLLNWLNADPQQVNFRDLPDMPISLALMVAGKGLGALGGYSRIVREAGVPTHVTTHFPSIIQDADQRRQDSRPSSLNVLLTEDNDESFALSELMLRKENVARARDGHEAVEMVKKQRFDIVVMDIHMGGMNGYTAIQAIRDWETQTANARTPIVILSSDDLETQRQSAARSGCSGFLRKPLRANDLSDVLDRLKGTHSLAL
jgi:CheY-like chemotaxis protein